MFCVVQPIKPVVGRLDHLGRKMERRGRYREDKPGQNLVFSARDCSTFPSSRPTFLISPD
jgi:hypothetical protein